MIFSHTRKGEKAMVKSRKLVSLALCLTLTATVFTGCGKKGAQKGSTDNVADYDHIYREDKFTLSEEADVSELNRIGAYKDRVYVYGQSYGSDDGNGEFKFLSFKEDGTDVKQFSVSAKASSENETIYFNQAICDGDGNFYMVKNVYNYGEDEDNYDDYYLEKYSSEGEQLWQSQITDTDITGDGIYIIEGRGVLTYGGSKIGLFSEEDGKLIKDYDTGVEYLQQLVPKDNNVLIYTWDDDGYKLQEFSLDDGKVGKDIEFPGSFSNYSYCLQGTYSDLLLLARDGIYTYNYGDSDVTYCCSYIDSDINSDMVEGAVQLSDTEFLLLLMDEEDYTYKLTKVVKVPAEEAKSQEIITLACYWMDSTVRNAIVDFNKSNPKYRISVTDYSLYDTDNDYGAGVTKLNTDIVAGNVPDIVLASTELPMEAYAAKDIFMDLDPLIEADSEFAPDDYLQNVFDSFRRDGKLYSLVPAFSVYTIAVATSAVGGKTSWTMKDMKQIADSKGIEYKDMFGFGYTRNNIMSMAVYLNASSYINWDKHECYFDSDEFKEFLTFMKEFPEDYDYSNYEDTSDYWRKGKALAELEYLGDFDSYKDVLRGTFGEDVTMIGFPTNDSAEGSSGSAIIPTNEICISASTDKKEGCWEFLKSFFNDEYQQKYVDYGYFPVKRSTFEKMADDAMKPETWINEEGVEETYTPTMYVGGTEVEVTPLTQAERDYIVGFIEGVTEHVVYDEEIFNIISEEAAAYFNGQKSVDDVAGIIQSRINIYVNENS